MEGKLIIEKLHLREFKLIKGYINSPFEFDNDAVEGHNFEVGFDMGFNLETKMIKADFMVKIETQTELNGDIQKADGNFEFVYIFEVENMDELVEVNEDNTIKVSSHLSNAVSSISYSTSRGILLTRFQGTALSNFIMPIIDPNKLLDKEMQYKKMITG